MVSMDNLLSGWIVLNDLLGALKEREVFIPDLTYADLRNSKMSLEYLRSFESEIRAVTKAMRTLNFRWKWNSRFNA